MISLLELYNEAKSVGVLYHFTTYKSALEIIKSGYRLKDALKLNRPEGYSVSFSRNKNLKSNTIATNVRFTVDGNKLSNYYKIEPYADRKSGYGRTTTDESEERVWAKNGVVDISKCLLKISVKPPTEYSEEDFDDELSSEPEPPSYSEYQNLLDYLKQNNINYDLVNNYKK